MQPQPLEPGELVQLSPDCRNPMFAGCIMVVTELQEFGARGYVQSLGNDGKPGGQAYYRAKWPEMERTGGMAPWIAVSIAEKRVDHERRYKPF